MSNESDKPGCGDYDRPNQTWICGHLANGTPCALGPNRRGACQSTAECLPYRHNDRWHCNRTIVRGGPCETGPTPHGECGCRVVPCSPRRSLRARRRDVAIGVVALSVGILCLLLAAPNRNEFLAPGGLAAPHAQILNADGAERCQSCHAAANDGMADWLRATLASIPGNRPVVADLAQLQSAKCMQCHKHDFPAKTVLSPHGISRDQLAARTERAVALLANGTPRAVVPDNLKSDVQCAVCHREHFGRDHNLSYMSNTQCQTCHVTQFESLQHGHPEFAHWPYAKYPRIAFDHNRHKQAHFPKSNKSFDCVRCHAGSQSTDVEAVTSYEQACADCHDTPMATEMALGIPFVGLPMLDLDALREEGLDIGDWPPAAAGTFDGRLPTIVRFLMSTDAQLQAAWELFEPNFDWIDLDATDRQQLRATAEVAWGIKRLYQDIATHGQSAVRTRIERALGRSLTEDEFRAVVAQLPWDTFAIASQQWFPNLAAELSDNKSADDESTSPEFPQHDDPLPANQVPAGGWFRDTTVVGIGYRPSQHGDAFLHVWIQILDEFDRHTLGTSDTHSVAPNHTERSLLHDFARHTVARECTGCHVLAKQHSIQLLWQPSPDDDAHDRFTRFDHRPHILLPQLANCGGCHHLLGHQSVGENDEVDNTISGLASVGEQAGKGPFGQVHEDFMPMTKAQCAICHTPLAAGDACTQCHRYHVDYQQPDSNK